MKFMSPVLVLIALAAVNGQRDTTYSIRKLFETNMDCNYQTAMLCKIARDDKEVKGRLEDLTDRDIDEDEVTDKILYCCNKLSQFEKKECLKMVRREVKDLTKYDTWTNVGDKYGSWNDEEEEDQETKYTKWFDNQITGDRQFTSWFGGEDKWIDVDTDYYRDDIETGRTCWSSVPDLFRRCNQCNQCRRRLERTTDLVARKACRENTYKNDRQVGETCCKAGRLVGSLVGKENKQVCTPGLYKFQTKVQGCNLNQKPECRRSFLVCCKQASDLAKKTETMTEGTTWF